MGAEMGERVTVVTAIGDVLVSRLTVGGLLKFSESSEKTPAPSDEELAVVLVSVIAKASTKESEPRL